MLREVVIIDEEKCDGCGQCVPACAEGALRIVRGKARLVSDRLCDGLGACLGHCPRDAIRIERREAAPFDERAVVAGRRTATRAPAPVEPPGCPAAGLTAAGTGPTSLHARCPSSRLAEFAPVSAAGRAGGPAAEDGQAERASELRHWPVQLRLLPVTAPVLRRARLLVCADCVPVAYADFHARMLRGHAVVIACPKLDDTTGYVEKLAALMRLNDLEGLAVAHMEVPCCRGLLHAVLEARQQAGCALPLSQLLVSTRGALLGRQDIAPAARPAGPAAALRPNCPGLTRNHAMNYSKPLQMLVDEHAVITSVLDALEAVERRLADDQPFPQEFYRQAFDFFPAFADRCHHAKEEAHLFPLLAARGIPRDGGPIGVMLSEHDQGRRHVAAVKQALARAAAGDQAACQTVRREALAFARLLRDHILKENEILFVMGERQMTAADKQDLWRRFQQAEQEQVGAGTHEKYLALARELRAAAGLAG